MNEEIKRLRVFTSYLVPEREATIAPITPENEHLEELSDIVELSPFEGQKEGIHFELYKVGEQKIHVLFDGKEATILGTNENYSENEEQISFLNHFTPLEYQNETVEKLRKEIKKKHQNIDVLQTISGKYIEQNSSFNQIYQELSDSIKDAKEGDYFLSGITMERAKTISRKLSISIFHIENKVNEILEETTDPEYIKGKEASINRKNLI